MSVVSCKIYDDQIVIGADSIIINGHTQEKDKLAKLNMVNDMIIADVGNADEGMLFLMFCKTRKPKAPTPDDIIEFMMDFFSWYRGKFDEATIENTYILALEGKAFYIDGFFVKEITDYTAIGAGMDFALSALYLGSTVEESIKTACHFSILCEEPVNILTMPKISPKKTKK